ncbi:four helix bundle protein [Maribacter chungangensis]|uniref:Four helix bundle protein n=1 Tax=Maribacter chungangensis TaxID=1069117 RepID=A0ABW3AY12_9FLAO
MRNDKDNIIVKKTSDFALQIIDYSEKLKSVKKYEMTSQLFRSGLSVGANSWEAKNAESTTDFIHKFKIAAKEADETRYKIELCKTSRHYPDSPETLFSELKSISLIVSKIIGASKRNTLSN